MNTHDTSDQLPKTNFAILLQIEQPVGMQTIVNITKKNGDPSGDWIQNPSLIEQDEVYTEKHGYTEEKIEIMDFEDYISQGGVSKIFEKRLLDFIDERGNIPELVGKFEINFEIVSFVETPENNREKLLKMMKIYHNTCSDVMEKDFNFLVYGGKIMNKISITDSELYGNYEKIEMKNFEDKVKTLTSIMK